MNDAAGESEGREALHLLESCADAVLRTDDGTDIPCCRYNILKTCSILKDLVDNFALDTDAAGRCILPVPNTKPAKLQLAMKLVHGVQAIDSLSLEEVALACDGLALLGCSALDELLMDRLSDCLANASDPALIKEHLQKLLHSEQHRQTALTRLVVLCPLWTEFKDMFLAMPMTVDLARFALKSLVKFYPADLVFEALLNSLPTHGLTPTHCFELFGDIGTGVYFHPEDVRATLDALTDMFEYKGWVNKSELIATSSAFAFLPANTGAVRRLNIFCLPYLLGHVRCHSRRRTRYFDGDRGNGVHGVFFRPRRASARPPSSARSGNVRTNCRCAGRRCTGHAYAGRHSYADCHSYTDCCNAYANCNAAGKRCSVHAVAVRPGGCNSRRHAVDAKVSARKDPDERCVRVEIDAQANAQA